ncbi:MAG: HEAT repeat domain-containing protein [Planctomycetota bacterium]|nr:HEAT repeat domain-containing protein [Planctomycetota bacterium]
MHRLPLARPVLTFLLCAGCAFGGLLAPARADDDEKARKGFDFGPDEPGATPTQPGTAGGARAPSSASSTDPDIAELVSWPDRVAMRAAERLFLRGTEVIPTLVQLLDGGDDKLQAGAAWVLGKIGEPAHVPMILRAAAQRPNASRASVFFEAAYGLDADVTRRWLISFLTLSTKPVFRDKAAEYLATRVSEDDQDRILNLLDADKAHVRIAGLRLLVPARVPDADERLVQALSDLDAAVAYEGARLLAQRNTDAMIRRLNALAQEAGARERGYAILALVEMARAQTSNPIEEATVAEMTGRRGLLHPEAFSRGTAAIGLAYGALESRDPNVAVLLDGRVVDTIINTLGGSHFRDFGSFSPSAFAALRRLAGRDLPDTAVAWAQWWRDSRATFRARRPLQKLDPADVAQAYVLFESVDANGRRASAEFVAEGGAERKAALLLERRVFEGLVAFLDAEGLFSHSESGGARSGEHVSVTLGVMNQRKRMTVSSDVVGAGEIERLGNRQQFQRLKMRMDALADANVWQRYRDTDQWADALTFWKTNVESFAQASPAERTAMLQAAIVYAYDDLPDDLARAEALARLQHIEARLTASESKQLLTQLTQGQAFGRLEAEAVTWVVMQSRQDMRDPLIEALAPRRETDAQLILAQLLLDSGVERIRQAFADERPAVRAAASHAARLFVESEAARVMTPEDRLAANDRLRPGLEVLSLDDDPTVSVRALLALGYLGDGTVVQKLEDLYRGGDFNVKLEVTRALGYIPGQGAHQMLTRVMAEERSDGRSAALRAAALESMARTNHKDSIRLLRYYLLNDRDEEVRESAGRVLAELGTDEARFSIIEHLTGGEPDAERRARLVDVLGRFKSEIVPVMLRRYLGDRSSAVQAAAALRAADHNMSEAFPFLLQLLRKGMGAQRDQARMALENLTSVRFDESGYTALAQRYEEWYEDPRIKGLTDRHWFREALKRKEYDTGPLGPYVEGEQDVGALPLLIRILRDADPLLRRNAAVALRRLTSRDFGNVDRGTSQSEADQAADQWSRWLERIRSGAAAGSPDK